jgi:DNA-3-methyladenine glycosylase I
MAEWDEISIGEDGVPRCGWGASTPDYRAYHDQEWGFPVDDDYKLFEKLCLEGFQAGLSWLTILRRRDGFRAAFHDFDYHRVAEMRESDVVRLLDDEGIIRHRGKIEATLNNAALAIEMEADFGSVGAFFWSYEPDPKPGDDLVAITPESTAMAKALKGRGFRFVGPTTVFAFMQAMGIVNDHLAGCATGEEVNAARESFVRPTARRGSH